MADMSHVIQPKSDQLNGDSLISGPITIKIRDVKLTPGQEQPCSVYYDGDDGKPYKPCKSMAKLMVKVWGKESDRYTGNSMTLYRDPKVKWAGMEVGGIRISHMSGLERDLTTSLTASKGNFKPYTVKPLKAERKADVVPLKVVAPTATHDPDTPTFDIAEFEAIVDLAIANMGAEFPTWWDEQKPVRLQARDTDKARAGVIATKANELIESLKGEC